MSLIAKETQLKMIVPRLIRYKDAPRYCGMDKSFFDSRIRPNLPVELRDGSKFVAFDRIDLDFAIEGYKDRVGQIWGRN
ncbi:hypothetical protein [Methylobacter psychrophilus]|uniref:hypothetical protein n=1 Tax=Methylobacter psychrophilus TaxID=96941 RepID=UPI0021D4F888|nr:hypothetical protein [Methylobacter psychrophilus]